MGEIITEKIILEQPRKGLSLFEQYLSVWVSERYGRSFLGIKDVMYPLYGKRAQRVDLD